jgi:hypothetical protein
MVFWLGEFWASKVIIIFVINDFFVMVLLPINKKNGNRLLETGSCTRKKTVHNKFFLLNFK